MNNEMKKAVLELNKYISETPPLLSLLYDMGLMPEQVGNKIGSKDWQRCYMLAEAWRSNLKTN